MTSTRIDRKCPANLARAWRVSILLTIATSSATGIARGGDESDAIWNDPVFKRQFIASYGINADVEPRLSPEDVAVLEKVRPIMAEDLARAEIVLQRAMKGDSSATLDFTLGGIRFQQDHFDEALADYERAVAKFPSFRRAWRNIGLIRARKADYDAAIRAFTRMIELGGADAYSYGLLGYAHSSKQDYQPAEAAYRNALLLQPDNAEWRLGLTRCVFRQGKFEDASSLLDVLITKYPDKGEFWLLQAHTFLGSKQPLKAAATLEFLDRLGKSTLDSLNTLGDVYVNEGLVDLALRAYEKAVASEPGQSAARSLRATEILAARGAVPQARALAAAIHRVLEAGMSDVDRHKLLKLEARLSIAEGDDDPETAGTLEEIVRLDPLDGEALLLLGQHHSRHGAPDRAILCYERATSIEAVEVVARIRHAQVLVGLGRHAEALPLLRRAQELKPREDVARYLEQVERISRARR